MKYLIVLALQVTFLATMSVREASAFSNQEEASKPASCTGSQDGVTVYLKLRFSTQGSDVAFDLTVQKDGASTEAFSGNTTISGGDGMMWATLSDNDQTKLQAEFDWWQISTMIPTLSLTGEPNLIKLKCEGLWTQ
jgi:hypothetical protein